MFWSVKIVRYDWSVSGGFRLNENVGEIFWQTHQKKVWPFLKSAESFNASIWLAKITGELLWPAVRQIRDSPEKKKSGESLAV